MSIYNVNYPGSSNYQLQLEVYEHDPSIPNNNSLVDAYLYMVVSNAKAGYYNNYNHNSGFVINGTTYSNSSTRFDGRSTGKKLLHSVKNITIPHNSDGSKSISVSAWHNTGVGLGNGSLSGTMTLTKIARASSVYCPDFNIGSSAIINISRADSSFTHTIKYVFGNLSGTIAEKTSETNIGWQAPANFFAQIPNSSYGTGTITCETYTGNTLIGTSSTNFKAYVVDSAPVVEATVVDIYEPAIQYTEDKNKLIRYVSNAKVTVTATAQNKATISSYKIVCGSKTLTEAESTFEDVESGEFTITVTDSRGFTTTIEKEVEIYEYIKPAYTDIVLDRPDSDSNIVTAKINGIWYNQKIGNTSNTLMAKFQYSQDNEETWSEFADMSITADGNTFSFEGQLITGIDPEKDLICNFALQDLFTTYSGELEELEKAIPLIDYGENDIKYKGFELLEYEILETW